MKKLKILIVAGEASADLHAGHLIERLRAKAEVELIGIGGDHLQRLGLRPLRHARDMAVVGLTEALRKVPQTLQLFHELTNLAAQEKPDFVLLLDLPDFNLRLAPRLKRLGLPIIYYISPQVWAWRSKRVYEMARNLDLLLTILPFEAAWYKKNAPANLRTEYVGHPVLEEIPDLPYEPEEKRLALLPGSRESEWKGLFGPMVGAAALLHRADSGLRFVLPLAEPLRESALVKDFLSKEGEYGDALRSLGEALQVVQQPAHECLRFCKAAWIASGTATLEAAIVGIPMVVAYRVSTVTAMVFRHLVRYQGPVAMVNLIHCGLGARERLVPEILQNEVEPHTLASAMREVTTDLAWWPMRVKLAQTRSLLQGPSLPLDNAVKAILSFLEERA